MKLYSSNLQERETASSAFRAFARETTIPAQYLRYWQGANHEGVEWPENLKALAAEGVWPEHAFCTANAALVVFWHRPGLGTADL